MEKTALDGCTVTSSTGSGDQHCLHVTDNVRWGAKFRCIAHPRVRTHKKDGHCPSLTTRQSANLVLQDEVKRGSAHPEPKAPPMSGGEALTAKSGFFTLRYLP